MAGIFGLLLSGAVKVVDQFFEYTTLLLPGNGTNGAQNNTFLDGSTNNFTITRNGNTTQGTFSPFSQTGWGNYFDGSGDWLTFTGATTGSGDFTTEAWVYLATLKDFQIIFDNRATGGTATGYAFGVGAAGKPYMYTNSAYQILSSIVITANSWNHVALVRNGTTITIYVNGVSGGTYTSSANFSDTNNGIGIAPTFTSTSQYFGYISNLRIVNGTAVYTSAFTPPTAPLTAISGTSLLTCQSNRFKDNSTNNFTLTVNGNTSVVAFSPFNPTASWSAETYGGSGYFDGSGDYLTVPNNTAIQLGTGDFEVDAWVYVSSLSQFNVIDFRSTASATPATFYFTSTGLPSLYDGSSAFSGSSGITVNQWNYVVWTRASGTLRMFVNGTSVYSASNSSNLTGAGTNATIGANASASDLLNGYLGTIRIVKGAGITTSTVPTAPLTAISGTGLLLNFTNAGIYDATSKNDLETVGNAQISTTQSKWGGSSMYFDGTGDYLKEPLTDLLKIGSGDYTFECWLYRNNSDDAAIYTNRSTTYDGFVFGIRTNKVFMLVSQNGSTWAIDTYATTLGNSVPTTTWSHIAISRQGSSWRVFIDGTLSYTSTLSGSVFQNQPFVYIGYDSGVTALNGYVADLRVTKGYARYTANFTAPTAAFPTL